ncbi:hypothetical protein JM18_007324 [Phytophthora kernoviae]|uniref:Amino acid transporter transmembrane domain-containing protein n=2 Tax=Phytophthora kernoviae TaxID=325452 RepID=A0A921SDL2_9STRA|nr:hypothetical protein G195_009980 [Phytophthora kernoviae 00238/432]KAG2520050.1 hypothetical protein JM18_007324 [Phytophthora kernoviae]
MDSTSAPDDIEPSVSTPMLPGVRSDRFAKVTGPQGEQPLYRKVFVCLRPGWRLYMKQFITLQEVSGAFGDIGLFLPLLTALAIGRVNNAPQIEFGAALFFAGVFTSSLSLYFNVPIPVQPMKTIAAVAIADKFPNEQIIAAGILMGSIVGILAITNIITHASNIVPLASVRGIQLGVGFSLMGKGLKTAYVKTATFVTTSNTDTTTTTAAAAGSDAKVVWLGVDSVSVSLVLGVFCIAFIRSRKVPMALLLFIYGMAIAVYQYFRLRDEYHLPSLALGPNFVAPVIPSAQDFGKAFVYLVLPQLPLTLLNSVVALESLATELFPTHHKPADVRRVCFSIASGNLLFAWFGMLPVCHGAGGLASQYAFGARSSLAMAFLGAFKVFFALLFGSTCVTLLQTGIFPSSVLGVLLVFSGLSLATVGLKMDISKSEDTLLLLLTAAGCLAFNTGIGFLLGFSSHLLLLGLHHFNINDSPVDLDGDSTPPWSLSIPVAVSVTASKKLSNWQTFYHLLSFFTGTGMLCLPLALVEINWYGVLLLIAAAGVSSYTSKLLVDALEAVHWLRGTSVSYSDLGQECFGVVGKVATGLLVHASFLILSTGYLALASSCLMDVLGLQYGTVMVLVTVCVWFQVLVPSLKALAVFSAVNVAFSFWIESVILGDAMYPLKQIALEHSDFVFVTPDLSNVTMMGKLSYTFSLLLGGLFGHSLVPTLYNSMTDPRQCSTVVARSTLGVTALLYLPICCVTYAVYGATLQAPVFFNMRNAVVRNLAIVLYSIHLLLSYTVTLFPLQRAFERWIVCTPSGSGRNSPTQAPGSGALPFVSPISMVDDNQDGACSSVEMTVRVLCRTILVLTTLFLGYFTAPSTLNVFAWMLVPTALLALVLPSIFYWQLCGEDATLTHRIISAVIAVLAIVTSSWSLAVVMEC